MNAAASATTAAHQNFANLRMSLAVSLPRHARAPVGGREDPPRRIAVRGEAIAHTPTAAVPTGAIRVDRARRVPVPGPRDLDIADDGLGHQTARRVVVGLARKVVGAKLARR